MESIETEAEVPPTDTLFQHKVFEILFELLSLPSMHLKEGGRGPLWSYLEHLPGVFGNYTGQEKGQKSN